MNSHLNYEHDKLKVAYWLQVIYGLFSGLFLSIILTFILAPIVNLLLFLRILNREEWEGSKDTLGYQVGQDLKKEYPHHYAWYGHFVQFFDVWWLHEVHDACIHCHKWLKGFEELNCNERRCLSCGLKN